MNRTNYVDLVEMFKVAIKFWRYMIDHDKMLETRSELRILYKSNFCPTLFDPIEKLVRFKDVMWCFRSVEMKVIEWRPVNDRENIVYSRKVRKRKTVSLNQSFVIKREGKRNERSSTQSQEGRRETDDGFNELKKKLVGQR